VYNLASHICFTKIRFGISPFLLISMAIQPSSYNTQPRSQDHFIYYPLLQPGTRCFEIPPPCQSVVSQSKPVYPSYHLEPTIPLPTKTRPSDFYRPYNILRNSSRPPQIRLPHSSDDVNPPSTEAHLRPARGMEEFIAVVFGNEVWMGLVDFKSDKSAEDIEEEIGNGPRYEK